MKFIHLFTKAPSYKRFSYEPRFYDARAEERKEREARIKEELAREAGKATESPEQYRSRIAGSFHAARRRSKASDDNISATLLRLGILLFLSLFLLAFLTWGKPALYSLLLFIPVYAYLRFKK
jgi:hypothetical protein